MGKNCYENIRDFMLAAPAGTVFAKVDFQEYGADDVLRRVFPWLVRDGVCKKVLPSVYYVPASFEGWENCIGPNVYDVASAKARNCGWTLVFSPKLAAYHFGLTEVIPTKAEFWISGHDNVCQPLDCCDIVFRHCEARWFLEMSQECLPVITAMIAIRELGFRHSDLEKLGRQLTVEQAKLLAAEKGLAPLWSQEALDVVLSAALTKSSEYSQKEEHLPFDAVLARAKLESERSHAESAMRAENGALCERGSQMNKW